MTVLQQNNNFCVHSDRRSTTEIPLRATSLRDCAVDRRRSLSVWLLAIASLIGFVNHGFADGSREDYERWESYSKRTANRVFRQSIQPKWFGEEEDKLWYRVQTGPESHEFVVVDASEKVRRAAFDHQALATSLSDKTDREVDSSRINLTALSFDDDLTGCRFVFAKQKFRYVIPAGPLEKLEKSDDDSASREGLAAQKMIQPSTSSQQRAPIEFWNQTDGALDVFWVTDSRERKPYGQVLPGKSKRQTSFVGHSWVLVDESGKDTASFVVEAWNDIAIIDDSTPAPTARRSGRSRSRSRNVSPDGKWNVVFRDGAPTLVVMPAAQSEPSRDAENEPRKFDIDLADAERFGQRVWWSPDSQHFVLMKYRDVAEREITMIESAPKDSIHGQSKTITYVKPGDDLDIPAPVLFSADSSNAVEFDNSLFDNPYGISDMAWDDDSQSFSFLYNQRGHQVLRLVAVDVDSKTPRTIIDETSETFVCYSQKKYLKRLDGTGEIIWMSERSGWNHLYLIDQETGKVKNAITSGEWVVRGVESVDEDKRQLLLKVSGIDPDQDPYHVHLVRVDFDGTNLTRLTRGDGDHQWEFSPSGKYLVDTFSRVDLPPVTQLRSATTGELISELEQADASLLLETGWAFPERFVAKGRDGQTDIYGVIVRPTNFDPSQSYPVLEYIYAGPHSAFVPKSFGLHRRMYEMAELGFVVVKMDGMGTSHRSKAFHDVCWQNLGDSGFPDRIAWIKEAAKTRPEMDISRVGIWGGSAGGQSAMRALIAHGDFYQAAVADCGCHDNRVDKIWWNEQWMGWPIGPHYEQQSNVTQAHRLKGDLMLIWGELDTNVDPVSTTQVINALIKADKDFEQLIMPGVGHGAAGHPYAKRRQADFFVRKLHGREPRHEK